MRKYIFFCAQYLIICFYEFLFALEPLPSPVHKEFKRQLLQSTSTQHFCRLVSALQQGLAKVTRCEMLT